MNKKLLLNFIAIWLVINLLIGSFAFLYQVVTISNWQTAATCVEWDNSENCIKEELKILSFIKFYVGISSFGLSPFLALLILQRTKDAKNIDEKNTVDFSNTTTILVTGPTGSGKTVWTDSLYNSLKKSYSSKELGFFVADMTRVEFLDWTEDRYLVKPVVYKPEEGFIVFEEAIKRAKKGLLTVLHIEECDMVVEDQERFEKLWEVANNTKNLITVFSTSRPSKEVTTAVVHKFSMKIVAL